jgi:hypothetical protein
MANYKKASVIVVADSTATDTIPNSASATAIRWTVTSDQINYATPGDTAYNYPNIGVFSFVMPYTGFYQINFSIAWPAAVPSAGNFVVLSINGGAKEIFLLKGVSAADEIRNVTRVIKLSKGDTFGIYCTQNSGSAAIPSATLSIIRVGNAS